MPAGDSVWATEVEWAKVEAFRQHISLEKCWQAYFQPPAQGPVTTVFEVRRYSPTVDPSQCSAHSHWLGGW
ncbi:MAG: hypothetical protein ACUVRV_03600 [Cyanobacteriota bacterium]